MLCWRLVISIESATISRGDTVVLPEVSLEVADGELMVLLGSSGSGKTSILRAIAGLDAVTRGRVSIDGIDMTDVPTRDRDVAMVFQSDTLFPTHTVRGNVSFPLKVREMDPREVDLRVTAESRALRIEEILDQWPNRLSEGYRQLAQIARALVRAPRVFLLDEPFARLDAATRTRLRRDVRLIQSGYGVTMIHATNDPDEALALGDRVAVLDGGAIVQVDEPHTVRDHPVDVRVARLTGPIGLIDVQIRPEGHGYRLAAPGLSLVARAPALGDIESGRGMVGVRPEAIRIDEHGPVEATVDRLDFTGARSGRDLMVGEARLASQVGQEMDEGDAVTVAFDRWHVFDPSGRLRCSVG